MKPTPENAEQLAARLAAERAVIDVQRTDQRERRRLSAEHKAALADITEQATSRRRARRERDRDETEGTELASLYRRAARSGTRARIRADIQRSAEVRALRVAGVRRYTLLLGLPLVAGFAAYSTPGVQRGMVTLLGLETGSAGWWTAWAVEPLLIAVAVGIILVKSALRMSGGQTDWRADVTKWGALSISVLLNLLGGWNGEHGPAAAIGEALAHSVGAIGAAVTAWLIGVIVDYASKARPWDDAPRLADLDLTAPLATQSAPVAVDAPGDATPALPVTQPGDAPVAPAAQPAQSAVTRSLTRVDAPQRRAREVVMRRPVSAPPADRDTALAQAADAVLTRRVSIRGAARAADVPEATLRRHINQLRTVAQSTVNGHSFESTN
ncbi:helix-turn-helix domain-containing protein [Micromonospora sp. NPDC051196]|uniref:helix-turn-helix domain-containing protein n=1 Tax=Micromonospora sp. NPDC051196 TaxID=3155281 RepID=UPI00343AC71A